MIGPRACPPRNAVLVRERAGLAGNTSWFVMAITWGTRRAGASCVMAFYVACEGPPAVAGHGHAARGGDLARACRPGPRQRGVGHLPKEAPKPGSFRKVEAAAGVGAPPAPEAAGAAQAEQKP